MRRYAKSREKKGLEGQNRFGESLEFYITKLLYLIIPNVTHSSARFLLDDSRKLQDCFFFFWKNSKLQHEGQLALCWLVHHLVVLVLHGSLGILHNEVTLTDKQVCLDPFEIGIASLHGWTSKEHPSSVISGLRIWGPAQYFILCFTNFENSMITNVKAMPVGHTSMCSNIQMCHVRSGIKLVGRGRRKMLEKRASQHRRRKTNQNVITTSRKNSGL